MSRGNAPRPGISPLGNGKVAKGRALASYAAFAPVAIVIAIVAWVAQSPAAQLTATPTATMGPGAQVAPQSGVPATIDGEEVFWGMRARAQLRQMTSDEPILIGVSVSTNATTACTAQRGDPQVTQGEVPPDDYADVEPALLTRAGCGPYTTTGAPGSILFPPPLDVEWRHDGPTVLRVHVNDARAKDCPKGQVDACAAAIVVDEVMWTGGMTDVGPHGFSIQLARALSSAVVLPDGSSTVVAPNVFAVPSQCTTGPDILYQLYGDSRLALVAFGQDGAEPELPTPGEAAACLKADEPIGVAEWVKLGSAFVLSYGGEEFDEQLRAAFDRDLDGPSPEPISPAEGDLAAMHELEAYLKARASGIVSSAWGTRLVVETDDADEASGAYNAWLDDAMLRSDANALAGSIEPLGQAAALDDAVLELLARHGAVDARLYKVSYPPSTSADLAEEFYVVFRRAVEVPSAFGIVRVDS